MSDKWTLTVDDDGMLTLPDDLIEKLGWKEGDELEWIDSQDGTLRLEKSIGISTD